MFTGLIQSLGKISNVENYTAGKKISIEVDPQSFARFSTVKIGDSIAVNGVCTTVISLWRNGFSMNLMQESLNRINGADFERGKPVNLELAMRLTDGLDGHIVTGHIDTVGKVENIVPVGISKVFSIKTETKYVVEKGSIALNGVSLTVSKVGNGHLEVSLIPHTLENTTFKNLSKGDFLNVEFDIFAKYAEKFLGGGIVKNCNNDSKIDEKFLIENGF